MKNIEPLTEDENWILHCTIRDANWESALARLSLPELERILNVETRKTSIKKLNRRKRQLEKEYADTVIYECETPDCEAKMPREHAVILEDGTALCKPCAERLKRIEEAEEERSYSSQTVLDQYWG